MGDVGGIGVGSDVGVPKVGDVGGIGLEEHWWHWVGRDIGGIGAEGMLVSPKWGVLVGLGWK